jgi:hypothetical protein
MGWHEDGGDYICAACWARGERFGGRRTAPDHAPEPPHGHGRQCHAPEPPQGWQCPACRRVWAPDVRECPGHGLLPPLPSPRRGLPAVTWSGIIYAPKFFP